MCIFFFSTDLGSEGMTAVTSQQSQFPFQSVSLAKNKPTLGHGAYGIVYEANCDELHCLAKCFHPHVLTGGHSNGEEFDMAQLRRDLQFVCGLSHPNLVQYLGTYSELPSGHTFLLMEKMDTNLSDFLHNREDTPLSLHLETSICHDITLGLHYLHSNGIQHYNLSSNNILLLSTRAKVSDYGLAKLCSTSHSRTSSSWPYLAPEMHLNLSKASEKSDVFSLGVCMIEVLTRRPPAPTSLMEVISQKTMEIYKTVPEEIRRRNHISLIDTTHPMLSIALDCIKNEQYSRPSAKSLCRSFKQLRENQGNQENGVSTNRSGSSNDYILVEFDEPSKERLQDRITSQQHELELKEHQLVQLQQALALKEQLLRAKDQVLAAKEAEIDGLSIELVSAEKQAKRRGHDSTDYGPQDQRLAQKEHRITELQAQVSMLQRSPTQSPSPTTPKAIFSFSNGSPQNSRTSSQKSNRLSFTWRKGKAGPVPFRPQSSVVIGHNGSVYITHCDIERGSGQVYEYIQSADCWQVLPTVPKSQFTIAIVQEVLVAVGGSRNLRKVNTLHAYSKANKKQPIWLDDFYPSMPTARAYPSCATHGNYLLVAGGEVQGMAVTEVEVLDVGRRQWNMVRRLPQFGRYMKMTTGTVGDKGYTYFLGGFEEDKTLTNVAYRCLISDLVEHSRDPERIQWEMLTPLPVAGATCVVFGEQLLAFGGYDRKTSKVSNAIFSYRPQLDKWERLSTTLPSPFSRGLVGVTTSSGKLIVVVVGGFAESGETCFTYSAVM